MRDRSDVLRELGQGADPAALGLKIAAGDIDLSDLPADQHAWFLQQLARREKFEAKIAGQTAADPADVAAQVAVYRSNRDRLLAALSESLAVELGRARMLGLPV